MLSTIVVYGAWISQPRFGITAELMSTGLEFPLDNSSIFNDWPQELGVIEQGTRFSTKAGQKKSGHLPRSGRIAVDSSVRQAKYADLLAHPCRNQLEIAAESKDLS